MPPPDAGFASLAAVHLQIAHAREETSRLRTEVTLASLSLEAEKNALQQTLTTTSATLSSPTATSDEVHILRSLSHQLIATRAGLAQLTQTESELVAERDALALQARLGSDGLAPAGLAETAVMSDDVCRQKFMHAAEEALEGKGNGGEMWREHALPNLGLLRGSKVSCGVVVDRVFEGVAVFTPGVSRTLGAGSALSTKGERECDYEIIRCGRKVMVPQEGLVEKFVRGFKTLLIGDSGGSVTLSAAGEAVECVQHLLETHLPRGMDAKNLAGTRDSANGVNLKVLADPPPKAFVSNPGVGTDSLNASRPLVDEKVGRRGKSRGRSRRRRFRDFSKERVHIAPRMSHMSKVLSPELMGDLLRAAPIRYSQSAMERLYCTDDDGIALGTFLSKVANRYPVFLLIRDTSGGVFGCYGSAAWRESSSRSYGSGECFVFRVVGEELEVFTWSGQNSFFQVSSHEHLAIGGGGHFALWLDEDLSVGTTADCKTFASPPLTPGRKPSSPAVSSDEVVDDVVDFDVVVVECWAPQAHLPN